MANFLSFFIVSIKIQPHIVANAINGIIAPKIKFNCIKDPLFYLYASLKRYIGRGLGSISTICQHPKSLHLRYLVLHNYQIYSLLLRIRRLKTLIKASSMSLFYGYKNLSLPDYMKYRLMKNKLNGEVATELGLKSGNHLNLLAGRLGERAAKPIANAIRSAGDFINSKIISAIKNPFADYTPKI